MENTPHKESYILQLDKLEAIVKTANSKLISEPPDSFISENTNFFIKSFLVIMCAYLESYLKDALMVIIDEVNDRLNKNKLPYNLIMWSFNLDKEPKERDWKFEQLNVPIKRKELDDFISGNPFRTTSLFKRFGVNLEANDVFNAQKERINLIVVKRNKILHHNDDASDVSNKDLIENISTIKEYIVNLDRVICNNLH